MSTPAFDRRRFLYGAGSLALLTGAGGLLSACNNSDGAPSGNQADANRSLDLPAYQRFSGAQPDLPGTDIGVDDAYRTYPADRPRSVENVPGDGSTVSGMANIFYAIPPGPDRNAFWAGLNEKLGVDLDLRMVPNADYPTVFQTMIAGSDLPDLVMMRPPANRIPNLPQLLDAQFTDLSAHLSGDAALDYPNLANLPTDAWRSTVYNGGIYGIPIPRGRTHSYHFVRQDLFEKYDIPVDLKGYDEFAEAMKALTDPSERRFALSRIVPTMKLLGRMNGEPNNWRDEAGKLTRSYETEEFKQTVSDMIDLWDSGVIHPDAFSDAQPFKQLFNAGTCAVNPSDGYGGWTQYILDNKANAEFELGLLPVYTRDGSELAPWAYGPGLYSFAAIAQQEDEERLTMLLRMLDWLSAPFGTEEYTFRFYGDEGRDHTLDGDGNPVLTAEGTANTVLPIRYLADSPSPIFVPGRPQDADYQHEFQTRVLPNGIADPTVGLFSNTDATQNATIEKTFTDGVNEIIQGRKPIGDLNSLVSAWRSGGGDQIRAEFEEELQQAG
ncbi:extracellular solute-binding protein [Jiangella alkaliphila]|uniref:Carbohydrate ABC transporter substrate-binding protein, CUT1 family n=1 Tax=Jiangella alkaliphila TaxID=419479 RepID=A0A1H2LGR2_9ACTN|nr:extracellular solute-binding protein [Jiangella alkaliphila]SDU79808.1 carbohydrate ABC transporter substrate-binding protein, CUT1 family [Jiangella alkaliphila]